MPIILPYYAMLQCLKFFPIMPTQMPILCSKGLIFFTLINNTMFVKL